MTLLHHHVRIAHAVPTRTRLCVHRVHRHRERMEAIRSHLLSDLADAVHSIEFNTTTGSIIIHHRKDESFAEQLAQSLLRLGLRIALDEDIEVDGIPDNGLFVTAMCCASTLCKWSIDKFELCALGEVFTVMRAVFHLKRVFAGSRFRPAAFGVMILDYVSDVVFGLLRAALPAALAAVA